MSHVYQHARPALTVDCVVFGVDDAKLQVLLIRRRLPPFEHQWALPGGFVRTDESLDEAAARELREETGLHNVYLEQLFSFGDVDRDPRERVVSVAYFALVRMCDHQARAATDAEHAEWVAVDDQRPLAFDHARILQTARQRLQAKVRYQPIGFELLPAKFTLGELQQLYETVLERPLDKRNFRRKILGMDLLTPLPETQRGVAHRAAQLFKFDAARYRRLSQQGFHFEI